MSTMEVRRGLNESKKTLEQCLGSPLISIFFYQNSGADEKWVWMHDPSASSGRLPESKAGRLRMTSPRIRLWSFASVESSPSRMQGSQIQDETVEKEYESKTLLILLHPCHPERARIRAS